MNLTTHPDVPALETKATGQRRSAATVLIASAVIFFLAESISSAAWTDHPYSYTYHYISDLGVRGPLVALDQYMYSALAWVMNTGFFFFGVATFTGVALLRGLSDRRGWGVRILATVVGAGGVVLAFFHGDGKADQNGTLDYHSLGALAAIVGGNVLIILLGLMRRRIGVAQKPGRAMIGLGAFGLVSMVAFIAVAGANVLVGLVERCAVYPVLIGLICAGVSIWKNQFDQS
jgi:hypothetical membrane protein